MPGSYHILPPDAAYTLAADPTRYPGDDIPQTIDAACGKILTRYVDEYASCLIANPVWEKDWCHRCVRAFHWTAAVAQQWKSIHGIDQLPEPINSC